MQLDDFKISCMTMEPDEVVQKCIIEGGVYFFEEIQPEEEFSFKKEIANILRVHIRDVVIVGSGKLGFSIKPDSSVPESGLYLFKKFDSAHEANKDDNKSDLDVGIVSSDLFDREMENLYQHTASYRSFVGRDRNDFGKYVLKGRFIVDFLPINFPLAKDIEMVQNIYKKKYGREVNLEIYKSWNYFESYHRNNVLNIKLNLLKE